jgi:hypothetical protein
MLKTMSSYEARRFFVGRLTFAESGVRGLLSRPDELRFRRMSATLAGMTGASGTGAGIGVDDATGTGVTEPGTGVWPLIVGVVMFGGTADNGLETLRYPSSRMRGGGNGGKFGAGIEVVEGG